MRSTASSVTGRLMLSFTIQISGEIHSSKNSRQIFRNNKTGRPFVAKSKASKEDEQSFAIQLATQKPAWEVFSKDIQYPILATFNFRRSTSRKFDYVNLAQGLLDALVKSGYIPDDNADCVIPSFMPYTVNKGDCGCDIVVNA